MEPKGQFLCSHVPSTRPYPGQHEGSQQLFTYAVFKVNPLNAELNLIRHLLALVGARHFVHVSRIRVKIRFYSLFPTSTRYPKLHLPPILSN